MANNPVVNSITFTGSVAGQASLQAQGIAGNQTFLLPNIPPIVGQVLTAQVTNGNNVFLGWTSPGSDEISTAQLSSVQGNGSKVQLTNGGVAPAAVTVHLASAGSLAILAYSGVTSSVSTSVAGGNVTSGAGSGAIVGSFSYTPPAEATTFIAQYQTDLAAAIAFFQGCTPQVAIAASYATQTFTATPTGYNGAPGFCGFASSTLHFTGGTITLDGAGLTNPVFVFQVGSALNVDTAATTISLINGATAANVVWVVGSSATFDAHDHVWAGQILAVASITLNSATNMTLAGRALANTGHVTISNNASITAPSSAGVIAAGDVVIYDANGNVMSSGILLSSLGGAAGVLSFNGRNGSVLPATNDYSFAQLSGSIATSQIPASTITVAQINSKEGTGSKVQLTNQGATTSGDVVTYDGAGNVQDSGVLLSSLTPSVPGGSSGDIQYNNAGSFAGSLATISAAGSITIPSGQSIAVQDIVGLAGHQLSITPTGATNVAINGFNSSQILVNSSGAISLTSASGSTITVTGSAAAVTISGSSVTISGSTVNKGVLVNTASATDGVVLWDNAGANFLAVSSLSGGMLFETSVAGNFAFSAAAVTGTNGNLSLSAVHLTGDGDVRGTITVTASTSQAFVFARAFASAPSVIITPQIDPTATGTYWVVSSTTGFTVHVSVSGTITFNYQVIG